VFARRAKDPSTGVTISTRPSSGPKGWDEPPRNIAALIRVAGSFDLAEDALQEALAAAVADWRMSGVPRNPGAWIMAVAQTGGSVPERCWVASGCASSSAAALSVSCQNMCMALLDRFRRIARFSPSARTAPPSAAPALTWGEESLGFMTAEELLVRENQGVPTIDRACDDSEALADEKQDLTTSLNFPLHWTTAGRSWDYLFEFSVACELLAPRPDDLILDFAAGTCWATELLGRLGVRTVSLDLSLEMMRRGRTRLATDGRLVFRDEASFVVGRGQALPFGTETFDGVLCLNALHHLPSYRIALREIHRVLKPGGRAVFSEPGTAHAVQPLSQFRMREEGVLEKNVSLPMIRRLAMETGFSRMRVVPLRSSVAYAFEYTAAAPDRPALDRMWDETLRLSPSEHARFVLHKGGDPPSDTLLPANQLAGRLAARIVPEHVSSAVRAGQPFSDRLRIVNTGTVTWRARGRRFGGQVTCGLKVCDARSEVLREDLGRTALPRDVAPGEEIVVEMTVAGLLPAGHYGLRYDMVVEGVTWFEFQGSPCARRSLDVVL
jgi:SAM-dependent methyltransferase